MRVRSLLPSTPDHPLIHRHRRKQRDLSLPRPLRHTRIATYTYAYAESRVTRTQHNARRKGKARDSSRLHTPTALTPLPLAGQSGVFRFRRSTAAVFLLPWTVLAFVCLPPFPLSHYCCLHHSFSLCLAVFATATPLSSFSTAPVPCPHRRHQALSPPERSVLSVLLRLPCFFFFRRLLLFYLYTALRLPPPTPSSHCFLSSPPPHRAVSNSKSPPPHPQTPLSPSSLPLLAHAHPFFFASAQWSVHRRRYACMHITTVN